MKKKFIAFLLAVLMLCSLFSACTDNPENGGTVTPPTNNGGNNNGGGDNSPTPLKDSLVVGVTSEYSQLVPLSSNTVVQNRDGLVVFALYDPLIWRDQITGELQPCIAESWEISNDGCEYILHLREDVTFHNGDKLTAEDVAWTLNLLPDCPSVSTQNYPTWDHAEVVDEYTVKIVLSAPFAGMLNGLAAYHIVALSKDYFDAVGWDGYQANPVGTGPYSFVERVVGSSLTLKAYDGYWGEKANITDLKVAILTDVNSQMLSLETGEIDVLYNSSLTNVLKLDTDKGFKVDIGPSYITSTLSFTMKEGSVTLDDNLRRAVLSAIDYNGINNSINYGYTQKAENMVAPGTYCRPEDGTYTESMKQDKAKAQEYLAASSYVKGTPVRMLCIAGSKEEQILTIVLGNLQELGLAAELLAVDGSTFISIMGQGDYEISLYNMMPSLFDANLIFQMYDRRSATWGTNANPYKEELADLAFQSISEMDEGKRTELFRQISDSINANALMGFLYYDVYTLCYDENLTCQILPSSNYRMSTWHW